MKTFIFNKNNLINNEIKISDSEFNHLKNVMRLNVGEKVRAVCFDDFDYFSTIKQINKNYAILTVDSIEKNLKNPNIFTTLFQALIKKEHLNLEVQKLTEIGIVNFIPVECEFCTVKKTESKHIKLQEISNQSIKQCGRSIPMQVFETIKFNEMVKKLKEFDIVIFANETENVKNLNDINLNSNMKIAIIIGCEGGFSQNEIEKLELNNVVSVSLGSRILRAETASICLSSIILNKLGEI